MGSSKGGGGAGAMLQYGNKALDLQKQQYEELKQKVEPYYQGGLTGFNRLLYEMGLSPTGAMGMKTAADFRKEFLPQYTSTATAGGADKPSLWKNIQTGAIYGPEAWGLGGQMQGQNGGPAGGDANWVPVSTQTQQQVIDNIGLDKAIADALAAQQAAQSGAESDPLYGWLGRRFTMDDYEADPGYQFRLAEGEKALNRALAAKGQFASMNPAAAKALQNYGQQMASEEYGNAYNRFVGDQNNIFNRLAHISGVGQNATGQLAGIGQNYANAAGELYTGMGNAVTAANMTKGMGGGGMFDTLLSAGANWGLGQLGSMFAPSALAAFGAGGGIGAGSIAAGLGAVLSDKDAKENIELAGIENGHNVYRFNYRGDDKKYIGVLAQEVMQTRPDAVTLIGDLYAVDYDKIGVKFREVLDAA